MRNLKWKLLLGMLPASALPISVVVSCGGEDSSSTINDDKSPIENTGTTAVTTPSDSTSLTPVILTQGIVSKLEFSIQLNSNNANNVDLQVLNFDLPQGVQLEYHLKDSPTTTWNVFAKVDSIGLASNLPPGTYEFKWSLVDPMVYVWNSSSVPQAPQDISFNVLPLPSDPTFSVQDIVSDKGSDNKEGKITVVPAQPDDLAPANGVTLHYFKDNKDQGAVPVNGVLDNLAAGTYTFKWHLTNQYDIWATPNTSSWTQDVKENGSLPVKQVEEVDAGLLLQNITFSPTPSQSGLNDGKIEVKNYHPINHVQLHYRKIENGLPVGTVTSAGVATIVHVPTGRPFSIFL